MDEPKFGTMFIACPKNNSKELFICTVLNCIESQADGIRVMLNFENLATGKNHGNGAVSLETYHENVKTNLFRLVDTETIKVMRILFTDLSIER